MDSDDRSGTNTSGADIFACWGSSRFSRSSTSSSAAAAPKAALNRLGARASWTAGSSAAIAAPAGGLCAFSLKVPPPPTLSSPIVCFASPAITPCAPVMHSWQVIQNFLQGLQQLLAKASSGPSCKSDCLHHFCVRQPTKAAHRYAKGQQLIAERKNQGERKVCASACCAYVSGFSVVVVVFTGSHALPVSWFVCCCFRRHGRGDQGIGI